MKKVVSTCLATMSVLAALVLAGVATFIGAYFYVAPSLPAAAELRDVTFLQPLRIYSRDGRFIQQFGEYNRTPVDYADVPQALVDAFIAAEDDRFFEHPGFDYGGILRAAFGVATGRDLGGGSTITQQVAREYFLSRGGAGVALFVRKFKEVIIAQRIEREFTKQEIMELFCNTFFFGHASYGVVSAAQTYFGKSLNELTLSEIAIIAGIPNGPSIMNPIYSVENARERRNYVLRRMATEGFITEIELHSALAEPIVSRYHGLTSELEAPYVAEMVRLEMIRRFGREAAYSSGLKVTTTIDSRLQRATNAAVRSALIGYDERHGYRGPAARIELDAPEEAARNESSPSSARKARGADVLEHLEDGDVEWRRVLDEHAGFGFEPGLVLDATGTEAVVVLRDGEQHTIGLDAVAWAAPHLSVNAIGSPPETVDDVLSRGDVVRFRRLADGGLRLGQLPEVQGAFVALDPQDGAIVALAGGLDYQLSNFNSATQSLRQPGSTFKPFVYSAALEHGYTPATLISGSAVTIADEEFVYRPENYSGRWHGFMRLREALVDSVNTPAIRTIEDVGIATVIAHMRRFGFEDAALPREAGLVLGSGGIAPVDLAAGYAVFANGGFGVDHHFIGRVEDADGHELYRASPRLVCTSHAYEESAVPESMQDVALESTMPCTDSASDDGTRAREDELVSDVTELYPDMRRAKRVIAPQNAYLMADMMRDVVRRGSGAQAYRQLRRNDVAGKTATTDDRRDTWFAGFNRDLVGVAWVGFFDNRPLGQAEQGGFTAIPMWIEFMRDALAGHGERWLEQPPGIVEVRIDAESGLAVCGAQPNTMFEKFRIGREPECGPEDGSSLPSSPGRDSSRRIFRR